MSASTKIYSITNKISGANLGEYVAVDVGYLGYDDMAATLGANRDELAATEVTS